MDTSVASTIIDQIESLSDDCCNEDLSNPALYRMRMKIASEIPLLVLSYGYLPTDRIEEYLTKGCSYVAVPRTRRRSKNIEVERIAPNLMLRMHLAYPNTWASRILTLVQHCDPNGPFRGRFSENMETERTAIVGRLVWDVAYGRAAHHFDRRFQPSNRHRENRTLCDELDRILDTVHVANRRQFQARVMQACKWLAAYLLDCYEEGRRMTFTRSIRQIVADSGGRLRSTNAVTRALAWITSDNGIRLFSVRTAKASGPGALGSRFELNRDYEYLLELSLAPSDSSPDSLDANITGDTATTATTS